MMTEEERKARRAEQARRRYAANPEQERERKRRQREANPERVRENSRERSRRYREANLEKERERNRRYRNANPERVRESERRYREANSEQLRERSHRYREANLEKERERNRRYRNANPERARGAGRRWREANPEHHRRHSRESARRWREANPQSARIKAIHHSQIRRARKRSATDSCQPVTPAITARRYELFGNICCFCGAGGKLTMEHVVALSKGGLHVPSNLAPSCWPCNNSKNNTPVEDWYPRQSFFDPERWEFLQANTGNRWAVAEQLSLALTLPTPTPAATP